MNDTTIAIDLAKSVFEVGVSERPGKVSKNHRLSREELKAFLAQQPQATIIMEACSSAHYWGRSFLALGHEVKLLPPLAVRPYVQRSKTDRADVKGMLEAARNSDIKPVPVKTESQQQLTALHRVRTGWMQTRTMRLNSMRGLLGEFGIVFPMGASALPGHVIETIENADAPVPMALREALQQIVLEIRELEKRIKAIEKRLEGLAAETPVVEQLQSIPGVGLLTSTALAGFVGDVARFRSARHFSCYLGLTPSEHSSGGRRRLGRISKMGDAYLRTLLTHGARSVLIRAKSDKSPDRFRAWALAVAARRGHNKAVIAIANKMARIVWAVWKSGKSFESRPQATA
jgi:transposase